MTLGAVLRSLSRSVPFGDERERCVAIHDFVRDNVAFGFTFGFESVGPEETLRRGRGHCNAQADLFRALLVLAGIRARLRFVQLDKRILLGAVPGPVYACLSSTLFHAIAQVSVGRRWLYTDSYIFDRGMFERQKTRLAMTGRLFGFGLGADASCDWDATRNAFSQASANDIRDDNWVFGDLAEAVSSRAGNNRLLGIHFNRWLGCIPAALATVGEDYLNRRLKP